MLLSALSQPRHIFIHGQVSTSGEERVSAEYPHKKENRMSSDCQDHSKKCEIHGTLPQPTPMLSLIPFIPILLSLILFSTRLLQGLFQLNRSFYSLIPFQRTHFYQRIESTFYLPLLCPSHPLPKNSILYIRFISIPPLSGSFFTYACPFSTEVSLEPTPVFSNTPKIPEYSQTGKMNHHIRYLVLSSSLNQLILTFLTCTNFVVKLRYHPGSCYKTLWAIFSTAATVLTEIEFSMYLSRLGVPQQLGSKESA